MHQKEYISYLLSLPNYGRKKVIESLQYSNLYDEQKVVGYSKYLLPKNISVVDLTDIEYPPLLKQIYDPPLQLFCKGDISLLKGRCITMVGTRSMTSYGKWCVEYLLKGLVGRDIVVVSGLARGIDGHIHRKCMEYGIKTVGVVAGGIDKGYPKSNQDIYDRMDLVISEYPPGREVVKGMFPLRNRILAGMSDLVVVIESFNSGGSMITAQVALEYGRAIACIPTNINKLTSQDCNLLISEGAYLIKGPQDLLNLIE